MQKYLDKFLDCDGVIDIVDVLIIAQYFIGLIAVFYPVLTARDGNHQAHQWEHGNKKLIPHDLPGPCPCKPEFRLSESKKGWTL